MSHLTIATKSNRPLKPIVEAALGNELRVLEAGIERTQKNSQYSKQNTDCLLKIFCENTKTINLPKLWNLLNGLVISTY